MACARARIRSRVGMSLSPGTYICGRFESAAAASDARSDWPAQTRRGASPASSAVTSASARASLTRNSGSETQVVASSEVRWPSLPAMNGSAI